MYVCIRIDCHYSYIHCCCEQPLAEISFVFLNGKLSSLFTCVCHPHFELYEFSFTENCTQESTTSKIIEMCAHHVIHKKSMCILYMCILCIHIYHHRMCVHISQKKGGTALHDIHSFIFCAIHQNVHVHVQLLSSK